jgi:oligopeptide transport system ATP-binding protein
MITHDLGVVAGVADKINVMYSGYIVESAPAEELFSKPRHPYTLGLLRSIPRIDEPRKEKLIPIEGLPPDLIDAPSGCPFVPAAPTRSTAASKRTRRSSQPSRGTPSRAGLM